MAALVSCGVEEDRISQSNQSNPLPAETATSTTVTSIAVTSITDVNTNPAPEIIPKTNAEYVLEVAKRDEKLSSLLWEGVGELTEYLSWRLKSVEHVNPTVEDDRPYTDSVKYVNYPIPEELMSYDQQDLIRIYYLLEVLSSKDFRSEIGQELELDTEDITGEHGGLFHLASNGTIYLEMLKNKYSCYQNGFVSHCDPDQKYIPEEPKQTLDGLIKFHFHAQIIDNSVSSTLSDADFFWRGGVVVTRVGASRFNLDYGLYLEKEDYTEDWVNLDLGVYEY